MPARLRASASSRFSIDHKLGSNPDATHMPPPLGRSARKARSGQKKLRRDSPAAAALEELTRLPGSHISDSASFARLRASPYAQNEENVAP